MTLTPSSSTPTPTPAVLHFPTLLNSALQSRAGLMEALHAEDTTAYRLFHGSVEGMAGLTIDRYGSLVLAQTFRTPLSPAEQSTLEEALRSKLTFEFEFVYNHRGKKAGESFDLWCQPRASALAEIQCREMGVSYTIRGRHSGIDPWLFLDLRAGRRLLRAHCQGKSVLNLFAYTCSAGVTAAAAGAREVWNVDFAASSLAVGGKNAELNGITPNRFRTIQEDCLPVIRQLAGLPAAGRRGKTKRSLHVEPRHFDWVFLDPPTWAKSSFGAVDIAGDYPSLFKPAVLIARPEGGKILATNHLASVELNAWLDVLKRCAAKAGRPLKSVEVIQPEKDFPSFDGRHPLKIAVCEV
jgi:23S rRNA (cytosine1962-C5)-methyltransferase